MNEAELIKRYFFRENKDTSIALNIGDDAAIIKPPLNEQLVITTDTMVKNSHFTSQTTPYEIATKLVAVNLSDVAAMGAVPKWATLTVTLEDVNESWLQSFSEGLFAYLDRYKVALIGGDMTKGKETNVAMQLIGVAPENHELRRKGASLDDDIYVTGEIGLAAHAVQLIYDNNRQAASMPENELLTNDQKKALYAPEPRLDIGVALRTIATSAIDISDGLLHEINILCEHNSLGAALKLDDLPIAQDCEMKLALTGGDDYELLFTAHKNARDKIDVIAQRCNCVISRIGSMHDHPEIMLSYCGEEYAMPESLGFDHFNDVNHEK